MKKHTKACVKRFEQYRKELAKFEHKYPNYCKDCGGTGMVTYVEDFSPHGSEQAWTQEVSDACPECASELICPLCGRGEALLAVTDYEECAFCDFKWEKGDIAPQEPFCDCWMSYERL